MIHRLLKLDPRVLRLGLVAVPAMVALLGWGQILRPAWQSWQSAEALHASARQALADLPNRRTRAEALEKDAIELDRQLDAADTAPTRLPALLDELARQHGVDLQPLFPGQDTDIDGLRETRYELEASGPYLRLVAWLAAVDARLANAALLEARFARQPASGSVGLKLRLAIYRRPAPGPQPP